MRTGVKVAGAVFFGRLLRLTPKNGVNRISPHLACTSVSEMPPDLPEILPKCFDGRILASGFSRLG